MNTIIMSRAVLACYLISAVVLTVADRTEFIEYVGAAFSIAFGTLTAVRFMNPQPKAQSELSQLEANLIESRKIVHQMTGGVFHYIATGSFNPDNHAARVDLREALGSPVIWITLLVVAGVMLVMPTDGYGAGTWSRFQLLGVAFLEFLLLSGGVAGLLLSVLDLIKRSGK